MSQTHTPGPWYNHHQKDYPNQITDGQMRICTMTDRSEQSANAKLIAAAPELLAACKEMLAAFPPSQYRGKHLPPQLESYIRAAIAKASGE